MPLSCSNPRDYYGGIGSTVLPTVSYDLTRHRDSSFIALLTAQMLMRLGGILLRSFFRLAWVCGYIQSDRILEDSLVTCMSARSFITRLFRLPEFLDG